MRAIAAAGRQRPPTATSEPVAGAGDVALVRAADAVGEALAVLDAAYAANDRQRWVDARARLDLELGFADEVLARSRAESHDTAVVVAARHTLAADVERAKAATEPPAGYALVAGEAEVIALLGATSEARSRLDFEAKERAVAKWIDGLTRGEAFALTTRLRIARADDGLVAALARFAAPRRMRLEAYLADLPRRLALRASVEQHGAVAGGALAIAGDLIATVAAVIAPVTNAAQAIRASGEDSLRELVYRNAGHVLAAIRDTVAAVGVVQPHTSLPWRSMDEAAGALAAAIQADVDGMRLDTLWRLSVLAQPEDVLGAVRELHVAKADDWKLEHSVAIASLFAAPLDASIKRMGERTRAWFDERSRLPDAHELTASCPLDQLVAEVMTAHGMVVPAAGRAVVDVGAKRLSHGPRAVACEWMGKRDRALWNWVRVVTPGDVTAEEVAYALCATGDRHDGASQAYRLAVRAPCFGLPEELARNVPEMASLAPRASGDAERKVDVRAFDRSANVDELARAQAPALRATDPDVETAAIHVRIQLGYLRKQFAAWRVDDALAGASAFIDRRVSELEAGALEAGSWQAALVAQERMLKLVAVEALDVLGELAGHVEAASASPAIVAVVAGYARAAGSSHLPVVALDELEAARRGRALLPVAISTQQVRAAAAVAARGTSAAEPGRSAFELVVRAETLRREVEQHRAQDPDAAEQLLIDARETALRARLDAIADDAHKVDEQADRLGLSYHRFDNDVPTVRAMTSELLRRPHGTHAGRIGMWRARLDDVRRAVVGMPAHEQLISVRTAVQEVEGGVASFVADSELAAWLRSAYQRLDDVRLRHAVLELAEQVGVQVAVGLATSLVGGGMFTAVRSIETIETAIAASKTVATTVDAAELATQASLMTLGQGVVGGEVSGHELAANLIGYTVAAGAFAPAERALARGGVVERGLTKVVGAGAARSGLIVGELAAETASGIIGDVAGHALLHDGEALPGTEEWAVQGVSIATTRFVAQRLRRLVERLQKTWTKPGPIGVETITEVEVLARRAEATRPTRAEASRLVLDVSSRLAVISGRMTELAHRAGLGATTPLDHVPLIESALADMPIDPALALADLEPVIPGHVYAGSREHISAVIANVTGVDASYSDKYNAVSGVHLFTVGTRTFELHENRPELHAGSNKNRSWFGEPVPELYDKSLIDPRLRGHLIHDVAGETDGLRRVTSTLVNDELKLRDMQVVDRSYSPEDRALIMHMAFLAKVPRWLRTPGPWLDPVDGIPLSAALTLRQMRMMEVPYGGLEKARMQNICNLRAIIELAAFRKEMTDKSKAALDRAAGKTHSVSYAETALIQSGHEINAVSLHGGEDRRLGEYLRRMETRRDGSLDPAIVASHDELIAKYGRGLVTRDTVVRVDYTIDLLLAPFGSTD